MGSITKSHFNLELNFFILLVLIGYGDVGYISRWTMEISNHTQTTIWVPVGFRICQLTFEYVGETLKEYHGKYGKRDQQWSPEDMLPKPYFDWDYDVYRTDRVR